MTDGKINLLTCISGKVNGVYMPIALTGSVVFRGQIPFLKHGESRGVVIDRRRNSYAKMLGRISLVHSTGMKKYLAVFRNNQAGRNHEIVGRERRSSGIVVGIRHQHTIEAAKSHAAS